MSIIFHDSSSGITDFASGTEAFLLAPRMFFTQHVHINVYRSPKAVMAQPKNFPFGLNATIYLKNITSDNNGIERFMFQSKNLPV